MSVDERGAADSGAQETEPLSHGHCQYQGDPENNGTDIREGHLHGCRGIGITECGKAELDSLAY